MKPKKNNRWTSSKMRHLRLINGVLDRNGKIPLKACGLIDIIDPDCWPRDPYCYWPDDSISPPEVKIEA